MVVWCPEVRRTNDQMPLKLPASVMIAPLKDLKRGPMWERDWRYGSGEPAISRRDGGIRYCGQDPASSRCRV